MNHDQLWLTGCLLAASGVGFGAFGAHGLRKIVSDPAKIQFWEYASHWQIVHSLGILVSLSLRSRKRLGPAASRSGKSVVSPRRRSLVPAHLFIVGITMFSGTLYCLILNPVKLKWMAPIAPMGGFCLIAGWVALGVVKSGEEESSDD